VSSGEHWGSVLVQRELDYSFWRVNPFEVAIGFWARFYLLLNFLFGAAGWLPFLASDLQLLISLIAVLLGELHLDDEVGKLVAFGVLP